MRILLPPSEGKSAPDTGAPVDPATLLVPDLADSRTTIAAALGRMCRDDSDTAVGQLKLGKQLRHYLEVNQSVWTGPTHDAARLYTGVLFEALALNDMPPRVWQRACERVMIFSGLWGVLRPNDQVSDYRCPAGSRLPGLDDDKARVVSAFWRCRMSEPLERWCEGEFLLDLRSMDYQAMWRPKTAHATVRVLHERTVDGRTTRSVVGHFNKATKGRLASDLLNADVEVTSTEELSEALRDLKYQVEVDSAQPDRLDVITAQP